MASVGCEFLWPLIAAKENSNENYTDTDGFKML